MSYLKVDYPTNRLDTLSETTKTAAGSQPRFEMSTFRIQM